MQARGELLSLVLVTGQYSVRRFKIYPLQEAAMGSEIVFKSLQ